MVLTTFTSEFCKLKKGVGAVKSLLFGILQRNSFDGNIAGFLCFLRNVHGLIKTIVKLLEMEAQMMTKSEEEQLVKLYGIKYVDLIV